MARNNNILVPGSRQGLDHLKANVAHTNDPNDAKYEIAEEQGIPLNQGDNGNIKAKDAGKIGGKIGGNMVRDMIKMAEEQYSKRK
ncbi:Small, acid-soluble spore protein, alpha/beta type [Salinibacillus kushneri]|uniref:Small, acid-soluble spore protein, alpha/beta type n=1 Tax=Salinibacillus kushneri TaxID=237682 RepID=A0A1H9YGJ3_9BACI|nr:alpha/beta-type small acid-soluble spore protein [Salinibacillus kushneri]SES67698.1 Small, acid-soluble spore protein, alpha/beta type [Salinibacillus kushneri]